MPNELKPEDVMKALELWIINFHGNATEFNTLCAAHRILRGNNMEIEGLRNNLDAAIEMANRIRAETITEFAERLKEKMNDLSRIEYDGTPYFLVSKSFIDKAAEEMKGEQQ